jgi:hypothetical protein
VLVVHAIVIFVLIQQHAHHVKLDYIVQGQIVTACLDILIIQGLLKLVFFVQILLDFAQNVKMIQLYLRV